MLSVGKEAYQGADENHIAFTALFARLDLDPLDQRANDLHRLRTGQRERFWLIAAM